MSLLLAAGCNEESDREYAEENVGTIITGDELERPEDMPPGLVLLEYSVEQGQDVVSGSVFNNAPHPMVNVQVGFELYNAADELVGTVADTMSMIPVGESRMFSIVLPLDEAVTRAEPAQLLGTPKAPTGAQEDPHYPQNNPDYNPVPDVSE